MRKNDAFELTLAAVLAFYFIVAAPWAFGRDLGQWEGSPPEVRAWFSRQMQPDSPFESNWSCCGPGDAYWADEIEIRDGRFFAIVTDDRDDAPLGRPHIDIGTRIEIPPHKFNDPRGDPNPTGHGIVFVSISGTVYCYFNPPGDG